jgi:hypothetical protein
MITLRTKTLLCLVALCGLGIGMLAPMSDGLYSAVLLFLFPFLAAFMALSIGIDLSRSPVAKSEAKVSEQQAPAGLGMQMPLITSQRVN